MKAASRARPLFTLSDDDIRCFGDANAIVRDGVLGPERAAALVADLPRLDGELVPARMGRGAARWLDQTERGDDIAWLEREHLPASLEPLFAACDQLMAALNRGAYLGLRRFDVQLARYRGGGSRYARHADAFRPRFGVSRLATAIYYANPGWRAAHGGLLRIFGGTRAVEIEPVLDRMVVFASERVEHEVLPCYAERVAITAWFYGDPG
jgi:SM-20-related protein